MTEKTLLHMPGIITVLNTPFTDDDSIDIDGLRNHVSYALDAGVAGFLVPAMAAEVGKLSAMERETMVRTVLETVGGRVPVIGGASAPTAEERLNTAWELIELGCDGILVSIPYETEVQYAKDVQAIADQRPPFLMLQDWDATGSGVPVPLIARLFDEVESFRCLKVEVVNAGVKYSALLEATKGRLHVSGGWAVMQMVEALDRGVHAFMPTGLHEVYARIFAWYQVGRRDDARALFSRLLPVLAFSNQHLDISIHFFKRLLHRQGIYATDRARPPILPFDAHHERVADELIKHAMRLMRECAKA